MTQICIQFSGAVIAHVVIRSGQDFKTPSFPLTRTPCHWLRNSSAQLTKDTPSCALWLVVVFRFGRDPRMRGSNRGCIILTARGKDHDIR